MSPKKYNTKQQKFSYDEMEDFDLVENESMISEIEEEEEEDYYYPSSKDDEDIENMLSSTSKKTSTVTEDTEVTVSITPSGPKKRGPKPNKIQFYVEPKEFDTTIIDYYNTGIITDNLANMINKIAHKLSYAPNFINYTYRDEMVGDAIVRMMKALISKKYTHKKGSNPFSYFTKIAFNAFRNRIKKEKYIHDTLQKYQEEVIMSSDFNNFIKNKKKYNEDDIVVTEE